MQLAEREAQIRQREQDLGIKVMGGGNKAGRSNDPRRRTQVTNRAGEEAAAVMEGSGEEVLIFEDVFEDFDLDIWAHDITMVSVN